MHETSSPDDIDSLAEDFISRKRLGERPSIEEYALQYPDWAEEIRELFPTILELELLKSQKSLSSETPGASVGPAPLSRLGDFHIVREVGRGGMGVVYEAVQESLHRRVALKVLGTQLGMTPRQKIRFRREAEAAARLHHTHIVPVYGVGEDRGLQFYAMQFIDGIPLNRLIRAWRTKENVSGQNAESTAGRSDSLTLIEAVQELLQWTSHGKHSAISEPETVTVADPDDGSSIIPSPLMQVGITHRSSSEGAIPQVVVRAKQPEEQQEHAPTSSETSLDRTGSTPQSPRWPRVRRAYWTEIAQLVHDVADGLEHAHHLGILHRDIKPANLLLDVTGSVWITDFGLAKMETHDHTLTRSGEFIGTLRYVAPEQLHGLGDARSDVYSLGLTLFELLTLQPAFTDEPIGQILQRRTRDLPVKPRSIDPQIPQDLETITLKATASDPSHRYQSAHELADDLQRFLEDRPILARPITPIERFWRWSRKNPLIAALGGLSTGLLVTLIGVLGVANYKIGKSADLLKTESQTAILSAEKAEKSAQDAQRERALAVANLQLAMKAFGDITDNVASRGSPVSLIAEEEALVLGESVDVNPADAALLERLLNFYDRFAQQNRTDLTTQMASIQSRIGDTLLRLGRTTEAEQSYTASIKAYEQLRETHQGSVPLQLAQAKVWNRLGVALSQRGQIWQAIGAHQQAVRLLDEPDEQRETFDVQLEIAQSLILSDTVFMRSGMAEVASEVFRDRGNRPPPPPPPEFPRQTERQALPRFPGPPALDVAPRQTLPGQPGRDGQQVAKNSQTGRSAPGFPRGSAPGRRPSPDDLEKGSLRAVQLLQKLRTDHPDHLQVRLLLARAYRNRYYACRFRQRHDEADEDLQTAIDHMTALGEHDPQSPTYRFELADLLCIPPAAAHPTGLDEESISRLERAIGLVEHLLSESPTIPEYQALLGLALRRLATIHSTAGKLDLAEREYRRAVDLQRPLSLRYPSTNFHQVAYVKSLAGLSDLYRQQDRLPESKDCLDRAIGVLQDFLDKRKQDRWMQSFQDELRKRRDNVLEQQQHPSSQIRSSVPL